MKHLTSFFAFYFLFLVNANAIVNIEKIKMKESEQPFSGYVDLSYSGASGNSENTKTSLGSRMQWLSESMQFLLLNYEYGESSSIRDVNKSFLHYRYINSPVSSTTWELFTQLETNEFTRLNLRALLGGGYRWTLVNSKQSNRTRLGLGAFRSREEEDAVPEVTVLTNRLNLYVTYQQSVMENIDLLSTLYYQPSFDDGDDYRGLFQLALEFEINDKLKIYMNYDASIDNQPAASVERIDRSYKTGLRYLF